MDGRGPTTPGLGDNNDHHGTINHWTVTSWDDPPGKGIIPKTILRDY